MNLDDELLQTAPCDITECDDVILHKDMFKLCAGPRCESPKLLACTKNGGKHQWILRCVYFQTGQPKQH
jgi:hypothetical protein